MRGCPILQHMWPARDLMKEQAKKGTWTCHYYRCFGTLLTASCTMDQAIFLQFALRYRF